MVIIDSEDHVKNELHTSPAQKRWCLYSTDIGHHTDCDAPFACQRTTNLFNPFLHEAIFQNCTPHLPLHKICDRHFFFGKPSSGSFVRCFPAWLTPAIAELMNFSVRLPVYRSSLHHRSSSWYMCFKIRHLPAACLCRAFCYMITREVVGIVPAGSEMFIGRACLCDELAERASRNKLNLAASMSTTHPYMLITPSIFSIKC